MSKERELLQKVLTKLNSYYYEGNVTIKNEIIELLAQPEQEQEVYSKGYAEAMRQQVYEAFEAGRKSALSKDWDKERDAMSEAWCLPESKQEPVAWMYEWAVRDSFDGSFTGEWKEEISRIKPDGIVKGFNPTKLERTVRNLIPLYKAHGIGGEE
jgi:hypothetical protein